MTNQIALFLGITIALCLFWDSTQNDWHASLFLARKFVMLVEWLAFWR